jgi:hypothetical protein
MATDTNGSDIALHQSMQVLRKSVIRDGYLLHKHTYIHTYSLLVRPNEDIHLQNLTSFQNSPLNLATVFLTPSLLDEPLNIRPQILRSLHGSKMTTLLMRAHMNKVSSLLDPRDRCR